MAQLPRYVLITPARNEAQFIDLTLKSVVAQTFKPIRWLIVSDGSTDGTDDIVRGYLANHPWIELVRLPERRERHFSGKVQAFNAGYERVRDLDYDVIGNLDGDISFDPEYFAFLLGKLAADPCLGVVGTPFVENGTQVYDYRYVNIEHVSGACQVFRRQCFEEIGGYVPAKRGGIDYMAVTAARMHGWKTRTFTEKLCNHQRKIGTADRSVVSARMKLGEKDYALGNHPLWELFRAVYQMTKRPAVVGGLAILFGYSWAWLRQTEKSVPSEMQAFVRQEQMQRLKLILSVAGSAEERISHRPTKRA
jgi:glycosyltransferase involved in cell wall biosynthesis